MGFKELTYKISFFTLKIFRFQLSIWRTKGGAGLSVWINFDFRLLTPNISQISRHQYTDVMGWWKYAKDSLAYISVEPIILLFFWSLPYIDHGNGVLLFRYFCGANYNETFCKNISKPPLDDSPENHAIQGQVSQWVAYCYFVFISSMLYNVLAVILPAPLTPRVCLLKDGGQRYWWFMSHVLHSVQFGSLMWVVCFSVPICQEFVTGMALFQIKHLLRSISIPRFRDNKLLQ